MHILFREQRNLDEAAAAVDLQQTGADILLLSFSDADLGAAAQAWKAMDAAQKPSLRLANLGQLRHPLSVDLYLENTAAAAQTIVIRLLGGLDYWRYGIEELYALCRRKNKNLAIVAGCSREDTRLAEFSTVTPDALAAFEGYFREGGPANMTNALHLAAALSGLGPPPQNPPAPVPRFGIFSLPPAAPVQTPLHDTAAACQPLGDTAPAPNPPAAPEALPLAVIVFYRSHLLSGDIAPIEALAQALTGRGLATTALYVDSLKSPETAAFTAKTLQDWRPSIILNATAFSARGPDDAASPLDAAGCPVLQLILAASTEQNWQNSSRGLSPTDMAMQIVLPERDGRLSTTAISFKTPGAFDPDLQFTRTIHHPAPAQIAVAADRALGWTRLAATPRSGRHLAIILSDYPGAAGAKGQLGHAIGLDSFASLNAIAAALQTQNYEIPIAADFAALATTPPKPFLSLRTYKTLFADLPPALQAQITDAWGPPEADPQISGQNFCQPYLRRGNLLAAVQPDRGRSQDRKATYHDPDLPPRHGFIAFYLWLRRIERIHALIHLGAHGTMEWLPGKALAPDGAKCFPENLAAGLPIIYPFIVNNPGEAVVARRRLGAVMLGHLTPPLKSAGAHGAAAELERLIDDYAAADGLDRRRTTMLRAEILDRAEAAGLLAESNISRDTPADDALARLDAYLCDVKDLQIRDGLHIFGTQPSAARRTMLLDAIQSAAPNAVRKTIEDSLDASAPAETAALIAALDGKFIPPGPAGAPSRGRADVLPTGRNLYSLDARTTPTRSAVILAQKTADAILRRHRQDHGDWPQTLVIDLWGSASLRTGGEDLALAFILMGITPVWDDVSGRVTGIEILPLATLDRPRIDVTLRISGLFRDAFEAQITLFNLAVAGLAARDEVADWNPLAEASRAGASTTRIFGPAPGTYGAGLLPTDTPPDRAASAKSYIAAGGYAYGEHQDGIPDTANFAARIKAADAFVHQQDHAEIDIFDGLDFAAFEGGFAAAAESLGNTPALYHADTSQNAPRIRTLTEEIARITRGKAANPAWIAGMMRHNYRGAAEISRALEGLYAFAATVPARFDQQFDLIFDATLGTPEVETFLRRANPAAYAAMLENFRAAAAQNLWHSRRNSVAAYLAEQP
jgi:cobaltochelatase CobN